MTRPPRSCSTTDAPTRFDPSRSGSSWLGTSSAGRTVGPAGRTTDVTAGPGRVTTAAEGASERGATAGSGRGGATGAAGAAEAAGAPGWSGAELGIVPPEVASNLQSMHM